MRPRNEYDTAFKIMEKIDEFGAAGLIRRLGRDGEVGKEGCVDLDPKDEDEDRPEGKRPPIL
jgi:hypothetical protein